jgi:hypothetical protein
LAVTVESTILVDTGAVVSSGIGSHPNNPYIAFGISLVDAKRTHEERKK